MRRAPTHSIRDHVATLIAATAAATSSGDVEQQLDRSFYDQGVEVLEVGSSHGTIAILSHFEPRKSTVRPKVPLPFSTNSESDMYLAIST